MSFVSSTCFLLFLGPCEVTKNIRRNIPRADAGRVRGILGQAAALGQWPWQVRIRKIADETCFSKLEMLILVRNVLGTKLVFWLYVNVEVFILGR